MFVALGAAAPPAHGFVMQRTAMPAAMQSVAMPAIIVPPTPDEAELLAAGLPCQPAGLGEMHTVQLIDLDGEVGGGK
jgi:hypothetical protein